MAEAIMLRGGGKVDNSRLTATPDKVRSGKRFYGSGTDQIQTGNIQEIAASTKTLGLNEKITINEGIHDGNGKITQSIPTDPGKTVYPTNAEQTVNVSGKYMLGDIYVAPLTGLTPENIKKGVTILGVTGTYEGYN